MTVREGAPMMKDKPTAVNDPTATSKLAGGVSNEPISIQALAAKYPNPSRPLFRAEEPRRRRDPDLLKKAR
jgi:hypothetical protein